MVRFALFSLLMGISCLGHSAQFVCGGGDLVVELQGRTVVSAELGTGESLTHPQPFEKGNQGSQYEFLVDTSYDSKVWFVVTVRNSAIIAGEIWIGGNDSDDDFGKKSDAPLICSKFEGTSSEK